MADGTLRPLIIVACFAAFFAIMTVGAGPLMGLGDQEYSTDTPGDFDAQYLMTNRVWANESAGTAYNITEANVGSYWYPLKTSGFLGFKKSIYGYETDATAFSFENNASSDISVEIFIIRNNTDYQGPGSSPNQLYHNFVVMFRQDKELVGTQGRYDVVSLDTLLFNTAPTDADRFEAKMDTDYVNTVWLLSNDGTSIKQKVSINDGYHIYVSDSILDDSKTRYSAINALIKVLTFQFTGNTLFDYMIGFPMWIAMLYVSIRIILACIPFIPGL